MSAQNIINAFSYLLENHPELSVKNRENILKLCRDKKNLNEPQFSTIPFSKIV